MSIRRNLFKRMSEVRGKDDLTAAKGSILGSYVNSRVEVVDPTTQFLVQFCACLFPGASTGKMAGLERGLKGNMRERAVLRKYIADSYRDVESYETVFRRYKRTLKPSHDDNYRFIGRLCVAAKAAGHDDGHSKRAIVEMAQSLGLSRIDIRSAMRKSGMDV